MGTGEIDAPLFDVIGVAWLIYGLESHDKLHCLESTRRTLEAMVKERLPEKSSSNPCISVLLLYSRAIRH